ncbi:pterin-4-alpha-carbinolamine dehydratase 2, mitochondrial-like [Gastrolobium bilobum]|uniref:pterin-4-alpha-carbinolamine dehydratase 2, mitochondrial-like n=1 Tax=Gastrolobium bilobum TaxID=150636 RepID=UPI002AB1BEC5|nr:pterin-4-alpha-carbinolamine dehydratase 2, mitochondrial-like [Gastrolobium bilobum]
MNRVLLVRRPLLSLAFSNPKLPLSSFFQGYSYRLRRMIFEIHKDQPGVSSLPTFTTFCTTNKVSVLDLSTKKCVPCNTKDLRPMTEDASRTLIPQVAQWSLVNEGGTLKLKRSWKVKTFTKGLEFFRIIADLAEAEGHHPDLHLVGWNNVTIEIWTHSVGGLTENDFILAAKISELNLHDLLRRKASD